MPLFEVELDDGRIVELESDTEPSESDIFSALESYQPPAAVGNSPEAGPRPIDLNDAGFMSAWEKEVQTNKQRQAVGRGYEAGSDFTASLADAVGIKPQVREQELEEKLTPGLAITNPRKAALERDRVMLQEEDVPYALRLGAAAHSGISKGMQLPNSLVRGAMVLGESLPSSKIATEAFDMLAPSGIAQMRREAIQSNKDYFKDLAKWESWMSERDAMLGAPDFGTQVAEGVGRGIAELPVQMMGGLAGRGAASVDAAVKSAAATAGGVSGMQRFGQEIGEGASDMTAAARGATSGLITGVTTAAFGATGIESIFRKEGVGGISKRLIRALKEGKYEFAEETLDQVQQELRDYIEKNPDKPISQAVNDVIVAGTVGGIIGTGMGAVAKSPDRPKPVLRMPMQIEGAQATDEGTTRTPITPDEQATLKTLEDKFYTGGDMTADELSQREQLQAKTRQAAERSAPESDSDLDENDSAMLEQEAKSLGVEFDVKKDIKGEDPFFHMIATPDRKTGRVKINPQEFKLWLRGIPQKNRAQAVRSMLNEEQIHMGASDSDAAGYWKTLSGVEKAIAKRIYTGKFSGKYEGLNLTDTHFGHEAMRRRIQRLSRISPTEIAAAVGKEKWTLESLDAMDRIVSKSRELLGTKASKEQSAMLDKVQGNLKAARAAVEASAEPAALRTLSDEENKWFDGLTLRRQNDIHQARNHISNPGNIVELLEAHGWTTEEANRGADYVIKRFGKSSEPGALRGRRKEKGKPVFSEDYLNDSYKRMLEANDDNEFFNIFDSVKADNDSHLEDIKSQIESIKQMDRNGPLSGVWSSNLAVLESKAREIVEFERRVERDMIEYGEDQSGEQSHPAALRPLNAEEVSALPRGDESFGPQELEAMTPDEVNKLFTTRDEKGPVYSPQYGSVIWGSKQDESSVAELEKSRDAAKDKMMAAFGKKDMPTFQAEQGKMLWYSGAIEGAKRQGGNYTSVLEQMFKVKYDGKVGNRLQFTIQESGPANKAQFTVPEGAKPEQVQQKKQQTLERFADAEPGALRPYKREDVFNFFKENYSEEGNEKWFSVLESLEALVESNPKVAAAFNGVKDYFRSDWGGDMKDFHEGFIFFIGEVMANRQQLMDARSRNLVDRLADEIASKRSDDLKGQDTEPGAIRPGITKKERERIELQRRVREAQIAASEGTMQPASEAMAERHASAYEPITPASVTEFANQALQQAVPSFRDFIGRVQTRHGKIQEGQLAEAWSDAVWSKLESATGEELKGLVDRLGLRREVFGQVRSKGMTVQLQGDIADVRSSQSKEGQLTRIQARAEALLEKAANLDAMAKKSGITTIEAQGFTQRADMLRATADRMVEQSKSGKYSLMRQESLFPGTGSQQATYTRGTDIKGEPQRPKIESQHGVGARNRAISSIARKLLGTKTSMRDGLNRKSLGPEDVRWNEMGTDIYRVTADDMEDLDQLGMDLTEDAATSASTQRIAGGGKLKMKVDALPRSATKRVIALLDTRTRKVHLVSGYRDGRRGPVFLDPGSVTGEHRSLSQMHRYRPMYSIPLDKPVQNFHQTFDSAKEFGKQFYGQVQQMGRRIGWRGYGSNPDIEGTEGLQGEGASLQGPAADIARAEAGMVQGARDVGADLTPHEARAAYDVFSVLETRSDIEHVIKNLRQRAAARKLTPKDWLVITGMAKVNEALRSEGVPQGQMVSAGFYEETLEELYAIAKSTKTSRAFAASTQRQFTERPGTTAEAGAQEAGPSKFSKELTMLGRRAPTDISRAEEGQPEVATGADPNRPMGRQSQREKLPPGIQRELHKNISRAVRVEAGKSFKREAEFTPMAETPGPRESYEVSPQKRAEIQARIAETINRIEQQKAQPAQPELGAAPQGALELGEPGGERSVDLPREGGGTQGTLELGALRARSARSMSELTSRVLSDFGSIYDKWMVDRIAEYGGATSKMVAEGFRFIIDREKQLYGGLTPLLDRARKLAGGIEPANASGLRGRVAEIPQRVRRSANAMRAAAWLNKVTQVSPRAAVANLVGAIEGRMTIPPWAADLVAAGQAANMEIGLLLQPVTPGFKAGGKYQLNFTSLGYDILRQGGRGKRGGGDMWQAWTRGLAAANKRYGVKLSDVRKDFRELKRLLDDPSTSGATMEKINQDMARKYIRPVTHVRKLGRWQPVIHSDLFNYLENAARRATHVRAFRETFPADAAGRKGFAQLMEVLRKELPDEVQRDADALIRAMQGHPTDDYSGGWQDYIRMGPQQAMGQVSRMMNATVNNVLAKMVLTGQMFVQPGEVIAGSTPVYLGYKNYLRAAARLKQLYPLMELMGSVNRVMHDYTFNPNSPGRSLFRIAGNLIAKGSGQNMLNELQEALAAASARVTVEDIMSGNMTPWQKRMLPQTFQAMGFTPGEVQLMMDGQPELLNQFQRKAAAFLTGGNKAIAEGSRTGANRLFNSIFRFQTYPMIKMNQARRVAVDLADAWSGRRGSKARASEAAARFLVGNSLQGALTMGITTLFFQGFSGLKIKMEEAEDEPVKFLIEMFLASMSGPLYILWKGAQSKGIGGIGEQAMRAAFPYSIMSELTDMASGFGQYKDTGTFEKIGKFLKNKTPGTKAIGTGMAMFGLSQDNKKLESAIQGLNRWKRSELGFTESHSFLVNDPDAEFRLKMRKVTDALKEGDEGAYFEAWMGAVGEKDVRAVADSLRGRKLLVGPKREKLTEEQKELLIERIGLDAFEQLEYYDLMLDRAADGVVLPPAE